MAVASGKLDPRSLSGQDYPARKAVDYYHRWREDICVPARAGDEDILRRGTADFVSFSYYNSMVAGSDPAVQATQKGNLFATVENPYRKCSEWGWSIDPLGLRITLNTLYDRDQKPLFIVENGLGAADTLEDATVEDGCRVGYLRDHIQAMKDAVLLDGVDLPGDTAWACVDLVSAGSGEMRKRDGFVYVDAGEHCGGPLTRYRKKSLVQAGHRLRRGGPGIDTAASRRTRR